MGNIKYHVLCFMLVASLATNSQAEVIEKESSWKYLVERTTTKWDKLTDKKEIHVDQAFVYYGAGAKQAGGQIKTVPQVVYVDANHKPLRKAVYYESAIVPHDSKKPGLFSMLPGDPGSDPNFPIRADILPKSFSILPLSPEAGLRKGLNWSSTLYLFYGESADFPFPATISHEVIGYERKKQRRCAVIEYKIVGGFKMANHPEWFTQEELREYRGGIGVKGGGMAYFDPVEGIIVEKEQTVSWTHFGEKLERLKDGKIGWVPTVDEEETVTIKVSLQPQEGEAVGTESEAEEPSLPPGTGHPLLSYLLIAAVIGIAIVGIILLLRKKAQSTGK
ncbi:MAG: hypothetical protein ACYSW4_02475 [Planctomycetota bacterium]|jgi:hypothetical protein